MTPFQAGAALLFALYLGLAPPLATASDTTADRLDVIELSSRYAWGIDTLDRELLANTFTPDAVAAYVGVGRNPLALDEHLAGFEAIFAWLSKSLGHRRGYDGVPWHFVSNHIVEMHGDTATLRFYMHNRTLAAGGTYTVDAVRTPAGWRIAKLHLEEQLWKPGAYTK